MAFLGGSIGDRKLVCDRLFAPLPRLQFVEGTKPHLCIVERIVQRQYEGGLV